MTNPRAVHEERHESALLAIVDQALADADKYRCPGTTLATEDMREIAEVLARRYASARRRRCSQSSTRSSRVKKRRFLLSRMTAAQKQLRPKRDAPTPTAGRMSALNHLLADGIGVDGLLKVWRWWLVEQPDAYKGNWFDTFVGKFYTYAEASRSGAADTNAGKFTIPSVSGTEATAEAAAAIMRNADNAGLEGGGK